VGLRGVEKINCHTVFYVLIVIVLFHAYRSGDFMAPVGTGASIPSAKPLAASAFGALAGLRRWRVVGVDCWLHTQK
jgi:hypothetical protein